MGSIFDYDTKLVPAEKGTCEKWILTKSHKGHYRDFRPEKYSFYLIDF
jgi:hypothetical protein